MIGAVTTLTTIIVQDFLVPNNIKKKANQDIVLWWCSTSIKERE